MGIRERIGVQALQMSVRGGIGIQNRIVIGMRILNIGVELAICAHRLKP
jgi:hypothetical protein